MKKQSILFTLPLLTLGISACTVTTTSTNSQTVSSELPSSQEIITSQEIVTSSESTIESTIEVHECHHVCDFCGLCMDPNCEEPQCLEKCSGYPHTILKEDFSGTTNIFGLGNEGGSSSVIGAGNYNIPLEIKDPNNDYMISFDMTRNNLNENNVFMHLVGLRADSNNGGNFYFAFQGDGYICSNIWKDNIWRNMYGYQIGLGGIIDINGIWNTPNTWNHIDIMLVDGTIEMSINNMKYISVSLKNIGGWNGPTVHSSESQLTDLFFDVRENTGLRLKNFKVEQVPLARTELTLHRNQDNSTYPLREGYNAADLRAMNNFVAEATFNIQDGFTSNNQNIQMCLGGLNGNTLGSTNDGAPNTSLNVQLNFNVDDGEGGFKNDALYPVFYYQSYDSVRDPKIQWEAAVGTIYEFGQEKTLKIKLISFEDVLQMYVNDTLVLDTSTNTLGIEKGDVTWLAIVESTGLIFDNLTMKKYTSVQ